MKVAPPPIIALAFALALPACRKKQEPPPQIRPVVSLVATLKNVEVQSFAGTIEPRYQSSFGFPVLGRVIARDVNIGDTVKAGARLAAVDPVPFELVVRAATAELSNAEAQLENAKRTEAREQKLFKRGATAKAQMEAAQNARDVAEAAVTRARANLTKAQEQIAYTQLHVDFAGVVTAVHADVGQVLQPGQSVATVARPDSREAVIDVPENLNGVLREGTVFEVTLPSDPSLRTKGKVREIAPQADPATRTRRVRIALDQSPEGFRLGTVVNSVLAAAETSSIELPVSALLERNGKTMVWVVDPGTKTVSSVEVKIGARDGDVVRVAEGLQPGIRVVTAGVNNLSNGQAVKIPNEGVQ